MEAEVGLIVKKHLENIRERMKTQMSAYGRNASGRSVQSLNVVMLSDASGYLEGSSSFLVMERGKRPGKVPHDFVDIIRQWILDKGISYSHLIPKNGNAESGLRRLSGAIAFSIIKNGTRLHRDQDYNDIYSSVIESEMAEMEKEAVAVFSAEIDKINDMNQTQP